MAAATPCIVVSWADVGAADAKGWGRLEAQVASSVRAVPGVPPGAEACLAAEAIALRRGEPEGLFALEVLGAHPPFELAVLLMPAGREEAPERAKEPPGPLLPDEVEVACGDLRGVLNLRNARNERYDVLMPDGRVLRPTQFEAAAGRGRQKKWRKNVIVVSTGETAEAWLRRFAPPLPRVHVEQPPGVA